MAASFGRGCGGLVATWRYAVPDPSAPDHRRAMTERVLPVLAGRRGVAGAHLLISDVEASTVETEEQRARAEANRIPRWILLVEGWGDDGPFEALCGEVLGDDVLKAEGASGPAETGLYRLQNTRLKTGWSAG